MTSPDTLYDAALGVLATADGHDKARASRRAARAWASGALPTGRAARPLPMRPARPERPSLVPPTKVKKRSPHSLRGRIGLLHALAHIELNAIDLAWDMVARFGFEEPARGGAPAMPAAFFDDWVRVGDEEALHFRMLCDRMADFGAAYGDLPAHDGLWEAAEETADDMAARLAIVPMVLEARGLDVTPTMTAELTRAGDPCSAAVLHRIYLDEIAHVGFGSKWFNDDCRETAQNPVERYRTIIRTRFKGVLKPPFNDEARQLAGLSSDFYQNLAG